MARPALALKIEVTHDLGTFADRTGAKIRHGAMRGAKRFEARAKLEYRQDVRRAGLGDRLANTWRTRVYPLRGVSWHPTVHVWSNARMLAKAHADGGVTVAKRVQQLLLVSVQARLGCHRPILVVPTG